MDTLHNTIRAKHLLVDGQLTGNLLQLDTGIDVLKVGDLGQMTFTPVSDVRVHYAYIDGVFSSSAPTNITDTLNADAFELNIGTTGSFP